MIYQLIKLDANKYGMAFILIVSLVALPILAARLPAFMPLALWNVGWGVSWMWAPRRANSFQMALPISSRRLFLARMAVLLLFLWVPAFAGAASALLLAGASRVNSALASIELTSAFTLICISLDAIQPERASLPRWSAFVPIWLAFVAIRPGYTGIAAAVWVTAVCLLLSAAVFAWVWRGLPTTYRFAPDGLPEAAPVERRSLAGMRAASPQGAPWAGMSLVRSVFCAQTVFVWIMLFFGATSPLGGPLACFFLAMGWIGLRPRLVWLKMLPLTRRAELATIAVPALALLIAGFLIRGLKWVHEPHARILSLAITLGWALATMLILALYDWRPLNRIPFGWRLGVAVALVGITPYLWIWQRPSAVALTAFAVHLLPVSLPLAILACAIPLLILAWALDQVYAEPEYSTIPRMPQKEWFN